MKVPTLVAAALLVLVGFSGAVAQPLAVTEPVLVAGTESGSESAFGGNGLTATEPFGGDETEPLAQLLLVLEIAAAGDTATLHIIVKIAADSLPVPEFTAIPEDSFHDGLGRRVRVEGTTSATWTDSIHAGDTVLFEKHDDGSTTKYVYAAGLRVARIDCWMVYNPDGELYCETSYYLTDHLGSTRKVLDTANPPAVTFTAEYTPWGEAYNVAGEERFRFTGEQHDGPTGFTHLRARQYDPGTGRFTGADPVPTRNLYAYAENNPLKYTDPSGECANLCAAGIGALVGGIAGGLACVAFQGWVDDCWGAVVEGAVAGGLIGACLGTCTGWVLAGMTAVAGAAGGAAGYVVGTHFAGEKLTLGGLGTSMLIGGGTSVLSLGIAKGLGKVVSVLGKWLKPHYLHRFSQNSRWLLGEPFHGGRTVDVSFAEVRILAGLRKAFILGSTPHGESLHYLGSQQAFARLTRQPLARVFIDTEVHESLHRALFNMGEDTSEEVIERLMRWVRR